MGVYEKDDLDDASEKADVDWWLKIFRRMDKISDYIMHFRFSQVIGLKYGRRFYKKRVPLGKGYPPVEPLTEALATYLVENATRGGFKRVLFVYTGLPEVKYRDLIDLYAMIMKRSVDKLMSKESQVEYGEFYKFMKSED